MSIQIVIDAAAANVVQIKLIGLLTVDDVKTFKHQIDTALEQHDRIGIVVDVTDWSDMSGDALWADAKAELSLLPKMRRIPRIAVLSDKQWYNAVMRWFGPLLITTEIRVFDPAAEGVKAEAIEFAAQDQQPTAEPAREPSIVQLPTDREDLLAFEYRGHLRREDVEIALVPLRKQLDREGKFDLLVRLDHFSGFDPSIILKGSVLSMKMAAIKKLRRYAIVGGGDWMASLVKTFDPLIGIEMKTFASEQEDEAWQWLRTF